MQVYPIPCVMRHQVCKTDLHDKIWVLQPLEPAKGQARKKIHHFLGYTYLHVVLVNFPKVKKLPGIKWANSHTAQPNVGKYTIHGSYGVFVLSQMCVFWGDVWFLSDGFITMLENILTFFPTIHICISKLYTSGIFEARMVSQHNCILENCSLLLVCSSLCVCVVVYPSLNLCSDILHTKNN